MSSFPSTPTTRIIGPSKLVQLELGDEANPSDSPLTILSRGSVGLFQIQKGTGAFIEISLYNADGISRGGWFLADTDSIEKGDT